MDLRFLNGFFLGGVAFLFFKNIYDFGPQISLLEEKIKFLENRTENLEDFRQRFYQIYNVQERREWDECINFELDEEEEDYD